MSSSVLGAGNLPERIVYQGIIDKSNKKNILSLKSPIDDAILVNVEFQNRRGLMEILSKKTKKITFVDEYGDMKTVYVKVKTAASGYFGEVGEKALKSAEEHMREINQRVDAKMEQLKDIEFRIPYTAGINDKGGKERGYHVLYEFQKKALITYIETHKEEWLKEVEGHSWVSRKVPIPGGLEAKVEIFSSNREGGDKLGYIDIRLEFVSRGSSKKVYQSLNYDVGKVTAGVYGMYHSVEADMDKEALIRAGFKNLEALAKKEGIEKVKKKLVLSKGHDKRNKLTKNGEKVVKSKLSQHLFESDNMLVVLWYGRLPDGTPLDERTRIKLMISAFESLEQLHSMGMVHADLKAENMVLKAKIDPITDEKYYQVRVMDYGYSENKNTTTTPHGTPGFYAPEQLKEHAETNMITYTVAADLYAMGVAFAEPGKVDAWWSPGAATKDMVESATYIAAENGEDYPRLGAESKEPKHSEKFQEGLNQLTHFHPKNRFKTAKQAREYFESLL